MLMRGPFVNEIPMDFSIAENAAAMKKALNALRRYRALCDVMHVGDVRVLATAAARDAAMALGQHGGHVGMEGRADGVDNERLPLLRTKDKVDVEACKGLRHGSAALSGLDSTLSLTPRALRWVNIGRAFGAS